MNNPKHVAIIMDGNGRWAQSRLRPRIFGHRNGAKRVREVVETATKHGVEYLTLFAFSEENWSRPSEEVGGLFRLLTSYLIDEVPRLMKNNVRLRCIGDRGKIPSECSRLIDKAEVETSMNDGLTLVLAISYSGRSDLVSCVSKIAAQVKAGTLSPSDIDEDLISLNLSTQDIPDPDLLIRTSGEQRISNFLLWELSYSEMYFSKKNWPEFRESDFLDAIDEFRRRNRRFGGITTPSKAKPMSLSDN